MRARAVPADAQAAVFDRLASSSRAAGTRLSVRDGVVEDVRPAGRERDGVDELLRLMGEDDQYRKVHEIGFELNPRPSPCRTTTSCPNELLRGVHFGLGLTPFTAFHIDLTSSAIEILVEDSNGRKVRWPSA